MTHLFRQGEDDVMTVKEQQMRERVMAVVGFITDVLITGAIAGGIMAGIESNMDAIIETGCNIKELENVLGIE